MGCQCNYCIEDTNNKKKEKMYRKQYNDPSYFKRKMPYTVESQWNNEYIDTGDGEYLHYLYDPFAKAKILRNPLGSVLGQYSTYGINFFEYNAQYPR